MTDHFTETSSQGFGSRLGGSFLGLLIGPLLVIAAIVLLWWNEGRAVQAIVGLKDADVGLAFAGHVAVARTVEMYQWKETKRHDH